MSDSIRIKTTPNGVDNYIKVKLEQDFDFINILSLKISQEDAYRQFCSDYGVVVGRVIVNSGFGVPNAKVSIFIPIDDIDKENQLVRNLYPYELVTDKNDDGVRYNVLPKYSVTENDCFTPVGTFPSKREVLDNPTLDYIYCKYYKFTTTTNSSGDFMFFGVPVGTYTLHVDVDLSDIGLISQRPYDLIREGSSPKLFESTTKFKGGTNLDKLSQIKTSNVGVNVQPFWGDTETCEIGITRADIDLNFTITPCAIFMGSIFGDQNKNSINKQCKPRAKLGLMCEQITGEGTIEMLRKTIDGNIERFDVDGGRLIDENGTWAYQVPMNLDYMITDEEGNLVPTDNTAIGLPTRASVRFRIGLDETGGEGRLRTRAKYLIPNNPSTQNEIDYNFDETTKDVSFRDLYWNKIYTVSNFIPRYQNIKGPILGVNTRAMTAIKNVDACAGDKTPFPYNRVNTKINPIFFIICLILKILGFIVGIINYIIIFLINKLIKLVNRIADSVTFNGARDVPYLPCITLNCETEQSRKIFAPGCRAEDEGRLKACDVESNINTTDIVYSGNCPMYYCGDNYNHTCPEELLVGWDDCVSFQIAKELGLFEFDFYNDWVNGSLFAYLLRYKKRRKGTEKFCEFDCNDFVNDPNYSGVDGNENAKPDNICRKHHLYDTCYPCSSKDCQKEFRELTDIKEGLIKKYKDELYYASVMHNNSFKLFATDLVCLGSVFSCDWQGFPFLQPYLVETTYKLPPDVVEDVELPDNTLIADTTGMVDIGGSTNGLFFDVDCIGLHTNSKQCLNLRHICEFGVDLDEMIEDPLDPNLVIPPNGFLEPLDIDQLNESFRNSFILMNSGSTSPNSFSADVTINSNFNTNSNSVYNFANELDNGVEYARFRGIKNGSNYVIEQYSQPKKSLFMYFGLLPGKTALNKMNQKYFLNCNKENEQEILIDTTIIQDISGSCSGSIAVTIVGGTNPYSVSLSSPTNLSFQTITTNSEPYFFDTLCEGVYVISVTDVNGFTTTKTISLVGPKPLSCSHVVTETPNSIGGTGSILVSASGGIPPYVFEVIDSSGVQVGNPSSGILLGSTIINGLPINTNLGYTLRVVDSSNNECLKTGVTINGPSSLFITSLSTPPSCFNGSDATIQIQISGGTPPYTAITTGVGINSLTGTFIGPLKSGQYTTTVIDANGDSQMVTTNVVNPNQINSSVSVVNNNGLYIYTITVNGGVSPYTLKINNGPEIILNGVNTYIYTTNQSSISYSIIDNKNCQRNFTS